MSRHPARWLVALGVGGLLAAGFSAVPAAPAHAAGETYQSGPFEVGNLLDYANSDFESSTSNWVAVSNADLSYSTTNAFLHDESLEDDVPAGGTTSYRISGTPSPIDIDVTPTYTYRVGAYFQLAPKASGVTVRFSFNCYDSSSGQYVGTVTGAANTLADTANWQYSEYDFTAPTNVAGTGDPCNYVQGAPEVTLAGLPTSAKVFMDEAIFAPYRAAMIIGAHGTQGADGNSGYDAQDWIDANNTIGPLQSDKEFPQPGDDLPATWDASNNNCYAIEQKLGTSDADAAHWPACVITFSNMATKSQLQAFFETSSSAPFRDQQMVIMVYDNEPELPGNNLTGSEFQSQFKTESTNIRAAAAAVGRTPEVFVAMDASTSQYQDGTGNNTNGYDNGACPYIPPASYVDFYLADHYDPTVATGGPSLPNEDSPHGEDWSNWLSCVQSIAPNKPIGLGEYGLNCASGSDPNATAVTQAITNDNAYLEAIPNATEPTIMWEYWYGVNNNNGNNCVFTNQNTINEWQSIETQNGGGTPPPSG